MMNKAQADIAYGFISIARSDPTFFAVTLMNNIFGQYSLGGRLGDSIRERQGMAYYVSSALDASVIPGPLMIRAGVSPANVERAIASIDHEVSSFAADGPTALDSGNWARRKHIRCSSQVALPIAPVAVRAGWPGSCKKRERISPFSVTRKDAAACTLSILAFAASLSA